MTNNTVELTNLNGKSRILLVCEHASNFIPAEYDGLGLSATAAASHISWDPGALGVAVHLSDLLDAPLISQKTSRLVYDCNRPPESDHAMRDKSEIYDVPGNQNLTASQKQHRVDTVYTPFRNAIRDIIDQRLGLDPVIVTIHSFTPIYDGRKRSVEIGVLHDSDQRVADKMINAADGRFDVRRNEPYGAADGVMHTLVDQAVSRGLKNVMIEIRNDLLETPKAQRSAAEWLAGLLNIAITNQKAA